jgi:hypothetical protein
VPKGELTADWRGGEGGRGGEIEQGREVRNRTDQDFSEQRTKAAGVIWRSGDDQVELRGLCQKRQRAVFDVPACAEVVQQDGQPGGRRFLQVILQNVAHSFWADGGGSWVDAVPALWCPGDDDRANRCLAAWKLGGGCNRPQQGLQAGSIVTGGQHGRASGDAGNDWHAVLGQAEGVGVSGLRICAILELGQGNFG